MSGALALLAGLFLAASPQDRDWDAVWAQLLELRGLGADETVPLELVGELEVVAREESDDGRGRLLDVHLRRLGDPTVELQAPGAGERPFEGVETWLAAEVLEPGPVRARTVREGLRLPDVGAQEIQLAWRLGVEDAQALRLDDAWVIQEALHEHVRADWSASNLALTLGWRDRFEEADAVLAAQVERGGDLASLWNQRGLLALGAGRTREARDHFGRALARGSQDSAVVLARLDLFSGDRDSAAAQCRGLVASSEPHAWALRAWGLSQLEPQPPSLTQVEQEVAGGDAR